jgi:uncharacterized protein YprB with RNaseH-like and TPR domain
MSPSPLLSRLKALRPAARREPADATDQLPPRGHSPHLPEGAERLVELLEAKIHSNDFGDHGHLRKWYSDPITNAPGLAAPETDLDPQTLQLLAPGASPEVADPRQWLFLDTETTGITGGTGTYPFMVGLAWWDAGGLEVEQLFMRDYSDEHSLLGALAERIAERSVLVTFNGKSFDWPLLETRYRMTRSIRVPKLGAHLDFLHPARNLWRLRIGSTRLAELELKVLGWNRGTDMNSWLIPQLYFDYLRGGPPEPLLPIFHHNQMDLRGLAALAARIVSLLTNPESHEGDGLELYGLSRICERRGEAARARKHYAQSIAFELPVETDRAARSSLARLAKRDGDFALALKLWESMLGDSREGLDAYEQLAIYYEHRAREPHRAAALAKKALLDLHHANRLGTIAASTYRQRRDRFEQRLARLEGKASSPLLAACAPESPRSSTESNMNRPKGGKFDARNG